MQFSTRLPPFMPVLCLILSIFLTAPAWMVAGGASDLSAAVLAVSVGAGEVQQQCLHLPRALGVTCWPFGGQGGGSRVAPLGRFVSSSSASGQPRCSGGAAGWLMRG